MAQWLSLVNFDMIPKLFIWSLNRWLNILNGVCKIWRLRKGITMNAGVKGTNNCVTSWITKNLKGKISFSVMCLWLLDINFITFACFMTAHESNDNNLVMISSEGWGRWSRDERQEEWSVDHRAVTDINSGFFFRDVPEGSCQKRLGTSGKPCRTWPGRWSTGCWSTGTTRIRLKQRSLSWSQVVRWL